MTRSKLIKPLIILFSLMMMSSIAKSQVLITLLLGNTLNTGAIEFGLTGGYNRNNLIGLKDAGGANNFNLGFYFDIRIKKDRPWYIYTGVLVKSTMGAGGVPVYSLNDPDLDSTMVGGDINRKINYFNVPTTIKYRFKNRIYLLGGFQFGLRHKATDEFTNTVNNKDDLVFKQNTKDNYKRLDAGFTAGLGYKFEYGMMMNLGLRYYYGLVDVFKEGPDYGTNSSFYIVAEIPIGVKRKLRPADNPKVLRLQEKEKAKQEKKQRKKEEKQRRKSDI